MIMKVDLSKYRILIYAIAASFIWHIFWLSVITIVVVPSRMAPLKFSRVSFLGPILDTGSTEFRATPQERSFLEKRYLDNIRTIPYGVGSDLKEPYPKDNSLYGGRGITADEKLVQLTDESVSGTKLEPPAFLH